MNRSQKSELLAELDQTLGSAKGVVFINFQGLKVNEVEQLRRDLHKNAIRMRVTKNTILRLALKKHNIEIDQTILDKPLAMVSGETDEVTPAKMIKAFAKEHDIMQIAGGIVSGQFLTASEVKALADLPSRDQLRAQLVGVLASPITGLVRTLQAPLSGLVNVLKQIETSKS